MRPQLCSVRSISLALFGLSIGIGCSETQAPPAASDSAPGEVGLQLDVGTLHLDSASYRIRGPAGFTRSGEIPIADSTKIAVTIGGIPAGSGFVIDLAAAASHPDATCAGSATFNVAPGLTTKVPLSVECHVARAGGSVDVGGTLDTCAVLDGLSATPSEVQVGGTITLNATAHDSDAGPAPITYGWSSTGGKLVSHGASATWQCTEPGVITVALSVTDGNPACLDADSVDVHCTSTPASTPVAAAPAPLPRTFTALFGVGLLGLGYLVMSRRRRVAE